MILLFIFLSRSSLLLSLDFLVITSTIPLLHLFLPQVLSPELAVGDEVGVYLAENDLGLHRQEHVMSNRPSICYIKGIICYSR